MTFFDLVPPPKPDPGYASVFFSSVPFSLHEIPFRSENFEIFKFRSGIPVFFNTPNFGEIHKKTINFYTKIDDFYKKTHHIKKICLRRYFLAK